MAENVMTPEQILLQSFANLQLPPQAADWLLSVWQVIQVFDDFADGDTVSRADLDNAIMAALVRMPANSFYQAHSSWLLPAIMQAVLKWQASDLAERSNRADARSFVWRAGYYDVVCLVAALVHGPSSELALRALSMYGETLDDYQKEFPNA
jgi:hypothetical protein